MDKEQELPNGWVETTLGECFLWSSGGTPNTHEPKFYNGSIPWLNSGELVDGVVLNARNNISEEGLSCSSAKWVEIGSVLIAMYGANIGKTGLAGMRLTTNQAIAYANPKPLVSKYLFYFLQSVQKTFSKLGQGAAQPNISQTIIKAHPFPLPPLAEQHRIVAKIEELFSELDKGVESLKTAQEQLKIYRQAVLQRAFEGKLTAEWRKSNLPIVNCLQLPANKKIIEDKSPLPIGWKIVALDSVAVAIDPQPSHRTPPAVENGIPYVGIAECDYANLTINFGSARKVSSDVLTEHIERYQIKKGDFIIGKIGTIGKPFKIPEQRTFALSANIVLIQPTRKLSDSDYLFYLFQSNQIEKQFVHGAKATTQSAFGIQKVRQMKIPYCHLSEQHQIVAEIESRLSVCDKLEESIDQSLLQAEALRQSILKKAFAGKLVSQDPQDEPAEKLLARIRAERAQTQPAQKVAKGRKKQ